MLDLAAVRAAWNLPPILASWSPEAGAVHQTLLFSTSDGQRYAWRLYRYTAEERERIVQEHALSSFVQTQGLPAITPQPLTTGETILEQGGRFSALFPFARGYQVPRTRLAPHEITAMGRCLGKLHQILRAYPTTQVQSRSFEIDQPTILAKLDKIELAVTVREQTSEHRRVQSRLAQKRAELLVTHPPDMQAFSALEQQVIHGDYQETNLFFNDERVCAIIDWDQAYTAPRAWEILRVLHYVGKLEVDFCRVFLKAYRQVLPLTQDELETNAEVYGWLQAHNFWVYEELYLKDNTRVQAFLEGKERVMTFSERWAALRGKLI